MKNQSSRQYGYLIQQDSQEYFCAFLEQLNSIIWKQDNQHILFNKNIHISKLNSLLNIIINEQVNCRSNHLNSQVHNFYQIQIPIPITKIPLKTRLINFFSKEKTCGT